MVGPISRTIFVTRFGCEPSTNTLTNLCGVMKLYCTKQLRVLIFVPFFGSVSIKASTKRWRELEN